MKIAIDGACLANERGYGRFARELLRAMMAEAPGDEFVLFVDERAAQCVDVLGTRLVIVPQGASPTLAAASGGNRAPLDMLRFSRAVWRERVDVFFFPTMYTYFPLPPGLPALITFHDTLADRFPQLTLPSARARIMWAAKTRLALAQSSLILTVSAFASREIQEMHGVPANRIRVAVEAPAPAYRPSESPDDVAHAAAAAGVPAGAPWFAYVGGFNPHKNLDVIVRAHAAVARDRVNPPHLVLVGATEGDVFHGTRAEVLEEIDRLGTASLVHWPGFVPDEGLRHLLSGATALLIPSENEGFGLPGVEAAACGTPVIATTASPLPELLEGGGFFVAPRDTTALERAMVRLLDEPATRSAMGRRALQQASRLSWSSAAQVTLTALREVAA